MEPILSLFLGHSRTYVALLEDGDSYPSLAYVNATSDSVFINQGQLQGKQWLEEVLMEIAGAAEQVAIALPMEYAFVHHFPYPEEASDEALETLVETELQTKFAEYDRKDLEIRIYPLAPRSDQRRLVAVIILEKEVIKVLEQIAEMAFGKLVRYDIAQNAAHSALLFNYPELREKNVVVVHIQQEYLDITALRQGTPVIYKLQKAEAEVDRTVESIRTVLEEMLSMYLPFMDAVAVFGEQLTRGLLSQLQQLVHDMAPGVRAFRLNAFRRLTTTLGDRERAYCARTAHLFVPCIGVALADQVQETEVATV